MVSHEVFTDQREYENMGGMQKVLLNTQLLTISPLRFYIMSEYSLHIRYKTIVDYAEFSVYVLISRAVFSQEKWSILFHFKLLFD